MKQSFKTFTSGQSVLARRTVIPFADLIKLNLGTYSAHLPTSFTQFNNLSAQFASKECRPRPLLLFSVSPAKHHKSSRPVTALSSYQKATQQTQVTQNIGSSKVRRHSRDSRPAIKHMPVARHPCCKGKEPAIKRKSKSKSRSSSKHREKQILQLAISKVKRANRQVLSKLELIPPT